MDLSQRLLILVSKREPVMRVFERIRMYSIIVEDWYTHGERQDIFCSHIVGGRSALINLMIIVSIRFFIIYLYLFFVTPDVHKSPFLVKFTSCTSPIRLVPLQNRRNENYGTLEFEFIQST